MGQFTHFWPKNCAFSLLWFFSKDFFKILPNEKSQEVHQNYINSFLKKSLVHIFEYRQASLAWSSWVLIWNRHHKHFLSFFCCSCFLFFVFIDFWLLFHVFCLVYFPYIFRLNTRGSLLLWTCFYCCFTCLMKSLALSNLRISN